MQDLLRGTNFGSKLHSFYFQYQYWYVMWSTDHIFLDCIFSLSLIIAFIVYFMLSPYNLMQWVQWLCHFWKYFQKSHVLTMAGSACGYFWFMMMIIPNLIPFSANFSLVTCSECKKELLPMKFFMKVLSASGWKSVGKA